MRPTDDQLNLSLPSWWFKIFGIVFVLGGFAALLVPAIAGIAVELLLGWLFLLEAVFKSGLLCLHADMNRFGLSFYGRFFF